MIIQTYKSRTEVVGKRVETTWTDLAKRLARPKYTPETMEDFANMSNEMRGKVKDVGGFVGGEMNGRRSAQNAGDRWLVTLDIDHAVNAVSWDEFNMLNTTEDGEVYNCAMYPTHSYTPTDPHLRWVFPLTRGVNRDEYRILCGVLSMWVGATSAEQGLDESTDQPERLMYWASCSCDFDYDSVFRSETDGATIDPDVLLASQAAEAVRARALAPRRSCANARGQTAAPSQLPAVRRMATPDVNDEPIPTGKRDQMLTSIAGKMRRAGLDANAIYSALSDINERRCDEPLPDADIHRIAESVARYASRDAALVPMVHRGEDMLDLGMYVDCDVEELGDLASAVGLGDSLVATLLTSNIGEQVLFTPGRGFMVWDGTRYTPDENKVNCLLMDWVPRALKSIKEEGKRVSLEAERARNYGDEEKADHLDGEVEFLETLFKFLGQYNNHNKRAHALADWSARCAVPEDAFDADAYMLNTPDGIIDLRTGEVRPATMQDRPTHITNASLSDVTEEGEQIWTEFLHAVSGGDEKWENYLQCVLGMSAIGKVVREGFFACIGEGGNGKSTMMNAVASVLGSYSGIMDNRLLTNQRYSNLGAAKATLRGKRLVIAGELEENSILSASQVKSITSSDPILGEEKYKTPAWFEPTHTVILYSNFLPRVTSSDAGTWRRIWVVPFKVKQYGTKHEIKRYDEVLTTKCGGAILKWIVEGARKMIATGYDLPEAPVVKASVEEYRKSENPLPRFLEDKCITGEEESCGSTELLIEYNNWARATHEHEVTAQRFAMELKRLGYENRHTKRGSRWVGLRLRTFTDDLEG